MTNNPLFDYILENIRDAKYSKMSHWVACKCPYCDSSTNRRHFNIQLKEGQPLIYKCFRASCGVSGVLNKKVARDLGLNNPVFLKLIGEKFNENILYDATKRGLIKGLSNIDLGDISESASTYFRDRTNHELTIELQKKFRICTDMVAFINNNRDNNKIRFKNLEMFKWKENIMGNRYIYFFNDRYTMVFARQINGNERIKMALVNDEKTLSKHVPYMFVSEGEVNYNEKNNEGTLFLGEGPFDIINAYLHIYKDYKGTFMASTSFEASVECINLYSKYKYKNDIVILSDDDVNVNMYLRVVLPRLQKNRIQNVYLVYNKNAKDLGEYEGKPFELDVMKIWEGK